MTDDMGKRSQMKARTLFVLYGVAACGFVAFIAWCTATHDEWLPGHVVPLYARWQPYVPNLRHLIPILIGVAYLFAVRRLRKPETPLWQVLAVLVLTSVALDLTIASMNEGYGAVSAPFDRYGYEYYSDVPNVRRIAGNPVDFLRYFDEIRPDLSMHGRTHPPGAILLLWAFWPVTGGNALCIATLMVVLASFTVIPMYMFTRDLAGRDAALTCASLYVVVPTVVLYNATSMNAVYALFGVTTIWLFYKAMDGVKLRYASLMGLAFALTFFMSYDMANLGTYFAVVFLFGIFDPSRKRRTVVATALAAATFVAFYLALYLTTGFNVVTSFFAAVGQVRQDLFYMNTFTPRAPYWIWRFANPVEVLFYAGVPVTVLFVAEWTTRLRCRMWQSRLDQHLLGALAMLAVFNFTYLGKSEMARVSGFYFPFILVPAALRLERVLDDTSSCRVLDISIMLLLAQTWLMETLLYMYW